MSERPRLSVVCPTRDRPQMIVRSLTHLLANSRLPDEIVVVDQSTDDATRVALWYAPKTGKSHEGHVDFGRPASIGDNNDASLLTADDAGAGDEQALQ